MILKRTASLACTLLVLLYVFTGCAAEEAPDSDSGSPAQSAQQNPAQDSSDEGEGADAGSTSAPEDGICQQAFGSYAVPEGWVKSDEYSTEDKYFYIPEDQTDETYPDNISVECGTNRYAPEEHVQFRNAIVSQLSTQLQGREGLMLTGDGTYTQQEEYILYIFTIEDETAGVTTQQFYIVGDKRYCMVHLTNFTGSEEAHTAARQMVDSFVWAE